MANNTTINGHLWNAKRDACNRGLTWRPTDAQAIKLFEGDCYWCGALGPNGIDRVNNESYYSPRSSVIACWICNKAKQTMSAQQWFHFCLGITRHTLKKFVHDSLEGKRTVLTQAVHQSTK